MALPCVRVQDGLLRLVMRKLESQIDVAGSLFAANRERMASQVGELQARLAQARLGGGPKYVERHRAQGKLPVRERIEGLLDEPDRILLDVVIDQAEIPTFQATMDLDQDGDGEFSDEELVTAELDGARRWVARWR